MESVANQISDSTILNLIRENNLKGWNLLYDKYTSMMYGIIYTHKDDKGLADEILINLFIRLKEEQMLLRINFALCVCIPYHTYSNAEQELKRRGINCTESPFMGNSILHIFNSQYTAIKKVAAKFKISKKKVKQNLHKEFLILRSNNQDNHPLQEDEVDKEIVLLYH